MVAAAACRLMMAIIMAGMVMAAEGQRTCMSVDIFGENFDLSSATIPSDCTGIDMMMNEIGDEGAVVLADALKDNSAITTLSLNKMRYSMRVRPHLLKL